MPLLLQEAELIGVQDQLRAGVIETFVENSNVLMFMDFLNILGAAYKYNMEAELPGIAFRGVNEAFSESTGVINPHTESLKIAGGDLDVDMHILRTRGEQVRRAHEALKIKAMARTLNKYIIDGNSTTDARAFDGLNVRLTGSQKILAGAGGAALTQDLLESLIDAVPGANALLVGTGGGRLITRLSRLSGAQVSLTFDEFGRRMETYNNIPIINVGKDATESEILDFDEDPGDATSDTTSIYAVRFGNAEAEQDLFGIQSSEGLMVRDLGELDSKPVKRTRVEWDISVVLASRDCAARLYGITNAVA